MATEEPIRGAKPGDVWASGAAYEPYVGRWSRLAAIQFVDWLAIPPGKDWLDVGCGTGALSQTILNAAAPGAVKGIDAAEGFIQYACRQITDVRADFRVGNALALPVESGAYDVVVSGLALNFFPDPGLAVLEMARAAKPGGIVAAYIWDYAGRMQFLRHFWNAAVAFDTQAAELDEGRRFPLCNPEPLARLFEGAGLASVAVRPIDIWTVFKDFDDFWSPFLGGQGPAPSYLQSLDNAARNALRERLRLALPFAVDGSIPLIARVWAVRGHA